MIKRSNMNQFAQNQLSMVAQSHKNWSPGWIGIDPTIGSIELNDLSVEHRAASEVNIPTLARVTDLSSSFLSNPIPLGPDQDVNPTVHSVKVRIAVSTKLPDRRFKESPPLSGASDKTTKGARGILGANLLLVMGEQTLFWSVIEDKRLAEKHIGVLNDAIEDVNLAIERGWIDSKFLNDSDLSAIVNYVLQGDNLNQGAEILRIGEKIVKEISGNYQYPIKMLTPQTGSSMTPADNVKTAPKYYENRSED